MKMKKTILWFLVVVLSISMLSMFALAGCKEEAVKEATEEEEEAVAEEETATEEEAAEEEEEVEESEKVWKIGFNNYADTHEFCYKVHEGIEAAAEEYGVELVYAEAEMDGQRMISNTQTFIDKGVDLMIDFNWIPEVGVTMLEMCDAAGVKLISMDAAYEGAYYFGVDALKAGQVLGEYAEEVIKEKWDGQVDAIVAIYYMGGGDLSKDRIVGCVDYLKEVEGLQLPGDEMNFEYDAGAEEQTVDARNTMTDFLTAHPDLEHILVITHNDETAVGAFVGIEGSERQEDCMVMSHGGDTPFHEHIRSGGGDVWVASVSYAPENYGSGVIPLAIDILEGKDVPLFNGMDHIVLNKDNLDELYPQE